MGKIFTITEGLENMGALRTGGQGSVYKGKRIGEIITAVKLLPTPIFTESLEDKNFRNFINEVEKLKKVNQNPNPNVVKILNSGITESGSFPFIEMEFIDGPDLEDLLKAPNDPVFTIKESIKVAEQLSHALSHCHKVDVKHGDIKSNNVKFNASSGNYILLDFGLAIMSDEQRRTSMRHAGAIEFMAPEQNEGKMLFETDVYSFGVVLYELLAGTVPFPLPNNGETARNTVMLSHLELPVPDLLEQRKKNLPADWSADKKYREIQVPQWLLEIVYKCLEKNPENRFKNGMDLHKAICSKSIYYSSGESISPEQFLKLQSENQQLQDLLRQYQVKSADLPSSNKTSLAHSSSDKVVIPKRLFFAGVIIACMVMGFAGVSSFNKSEPETAYYIPVVDSNFVEDQNRITGNSINRFGPFRPVAVRSPKEDSIRNAEIQAAIEKYRRSNYNRAASQGNKKWKRKKFLGLF